MTTPVIEYVEREGKVFEFGDYPDKGFSLTADQFLAANPGMGQGVPIGLEHFLKPHALQDKMGGIVSAEVRDNALWAKTRLPRPLLDLLGPDEPLKVSAHFSKADNTWKRLDIVLNPRIKDAALFAEAEPLPEGEPTLDGPEVVFDAPRHRHHREQPGQSPLLAQDFHDIAANCMPGLCSGAAVFARGDMTRKHWQLVHTKSINHGATCPGMSGRFSEETDMTETPVEEKAGDATFSDADVAALKSEIAALRVENRETRQKGLLKDAAVFAENEVRAGRATVPERPLIVKGYLRAALDDAENPADATFSVGDVTFSAPRLADFIALQAARPVARLGGPFTTNDPVAPHGQRDGVIAFSNDATPSELTPADKARLDKLAANA